MDVLVSVDAKSDQGGSNGTPVAAFEALSALGEGERCGAVVANGSGDSSGH